MAKPTLNYYHVLNVAKVKTDVAYFTTIQAAIASIAAGGYTPTAANPFAIYVHPGTYSEQVTMANFVDVIAQGGREETIIDLLAPEADEPTVIGANAMIKGFTIVSDGGSFQPRCVENSAAGEGGADGFEIDDCALQIDNVGAHTPIVLLATNSMEIRNSQIDTAGVALTAVSLDTSTENYSIYNCLIGGGTYSILVTDANTLYLNGCALANELEHTDCTVETIIRDCILEEIDFNGGLLCEIHHSYVETIAVDGGIVDAFGGTIRACTASAGTRFTWRLDDANFHVLQNMVIQDAIGQATAGDVIHLDAVRYTETITLADGVHIEGVTSDTDTPTEIYWTTDTTAVVTAGAVECSIRRVKIYQDNAGGTAYCLSVTLAAVLVFSDCVFECDGTDAIHMINGNVTLNDCTVTLGNINLSTDPCTLKMDHSSMVSGTLITAAADVVHTVTCLFCDFNGQDVHLGSIGDTITEFRYCTDIDDFYDAGTAAGSLVIENSNITTASKNAVATATKAWTVREASIDSLANDGGAGTGTITMYGGYLGICTDSTSPNVWWLNSRELMVIENMVIQDAIDAATAAGPPTATDPYVVRVGPGTYTEQIAMDDYCDVIAVSGRADTIIYHECTADSQATVTGENALIKGFTIQSYGGVASTWMTRCVNAGTAGFDIEDCILEPSNAAAGAITLNATANCNIWDCLVDNAGAAATGALFTTGAQTYIVRGTTFNAATDAIQVTTAITALNLTECTVLDNFNQDGGTVNVYRCRLEALALGTASCTFRAEFTQYTGAITTTAEDLAHDITLIQCDLQGGGVDSSAVGASSTTTLDMRGCSNVGKLTNDGIGNWEVRDSDVQDCETTNTGFITIFGGDVATCTVAAAGGDIVWWKDTNLIYVIPNMHIEHALTDAALAAGDTIKLGQGTWVESDLNMINGVDIIGQGSGLSIIDASDNTNPVIVVGNNVSCEIHDITIDNDDVGGAITISPVANNSALVLEECNVISSAAVDAVVVTMGGAGTGTLTARRTDFTSDAANSIILMASTDGGLGYLNATDCTFNTAAIAIELTSSNVVDVNVTRATFDTCTLAVYSTGDIHTIDIDFSEFNGSGVLAAGVELAGNAPVCNFTNCNDIGTFTHSVACTVTLHDCWISGAYTIAAVAGIVNAFNTQFAAFINNGDGAGITFQECLGADFSNNLTSTVTIEGGNWDTVLQAGTAGTIDIYEATIATELDCGNTGAINAYNCHVATIDANAGSVVTLYGGTLLDVADNTGQIIWWEAPHRLRVIAAATANMKIMDAADAAAAGDLIVIGPGTFAEALALDTAVNACTYQGAGREDTIIQLAAADVVTITVDGVVLEDLTIEITGGAGHDCVTTANATVIRHCNIIATSAAVTECHGIATTGTGGVTVDGCDITSSGHASSDGIYLTGTGATVVMESIINATLADINQQADITGDLQTYNNELAGGGFKIGNNAAYNCYAHGDVFTAVTHDGLGHMFLQNEPNIALVREGMKIADGIALATADTPSVANPWTVLVGPGVYTEQITMDDYVSVIAESGYEVTKITWEVAAAHDEPTITMESNCRLEGFTIESDGNGDLYRARCVDSTAMSDWLIKDCLFVQVDSAVAANQAVFLETSGTGMRLEHCRWSQATTDDIKRGLQVDAAGIEVLLQDCETYGEDYDFYLNEGKVETRKCMIRGGGWYITDDADSIGVSWDDDWNDGVAPVTFAGTNGEFADLSGAREYTCAADLLIGEACYISGANAVDEATNASGAPLPAEGIVVWKSAADALTCYVKKHGYIYWANPAPAWVAGTTMFLGVNGAMVNARPANAIAQIIGVCKGTKEMLINITLTDAGTAVISTHLVLPELGVGAAQGVHDRWPVIIMDSGAQTCHFALKVPDDFLSLSKVYIVGIPTTGGTISCTVNTSAGDCEGAEATIQDTMSIVTEAIVDDRLENLDVTTAFDVLGLAQARMVGVQFVLDALVTTTQFNVVGLYMEYVKA